MVQLSIVGKLLEEFKQQRPMRGGSLIVSIFGDSISQHGGSVWLGSLIDVLEPFGLNQRLVRTSVYRLIQEGWLVSTQIGRRSYYSFTDFGLRQYQKTADRIYAANRSPWGGSWTLVLPAFIVDEQRDELRKELRWLGFGSLAQGILAKPGLHRRSLDETLQDLGVADKVVVMSAQTDELISQGVLKQLSRNCWNLDELEIRYQMFLDKFRPVLQDIKKKPELTPEQCFQLRTLLIHEYRRILLKDTELPDELLPNDWAGKAAFNLTANIYRATFEDAESYLLSTMETSEGPLPRAVDEFYHRFGGLKPLS